VLVDKLHDIVKLQTIDARRAIHGQGNFELAPWVKKFKTTSAAWDAKSKSQKDKIFMNFISHKAFFCLLFDIGDLPVQPV